MRTLLSKRDEQRIKSVNIGEINIGDIFTFPKGDRLQHKVCSVGIRGIYLDNMDFGRSNKKALLTWKQIAFLMTRNNFKNVNKPKRHT